ncbi:MAG: pseudaminic acid synthase [Reinekea sp.]
MMIINQRKIGPDEPPYVIAEVSANHRGDINQAKATIQMAKECGADAVKIQTYTPDTMTLDVSNEEFIIKGGLWDGYSLYELYKEAHTPYEWHPELFEYAERIGITLFSTPFDETAIELLESLNTPAYKVASFEATDLPLLDAIGRTGKPVVLSTGLANEAEINEAIKTLTDAGTRDLAVLHCISGYPTPTEQANVKTVQAIAECWPDVIPGLSDHTLSPAAACAAVALGACVVEKHVIVDRNLAGPDASFSLEPDELTLLTSLLRDVKKSLGEPGFQLKAAEADNLKFRRSLYIAQNVRKGEPVTAINVRRVRPGFGLAPKQYPVVQGKVFKTDLPAGTALRWEHIE